MKDDRDDIDIKNIYRISATVMYALAVFYLALQCAYYGIFSQLIVRPQHGFLKRLYDAIFPHNEALYVAVMLSMFFFIVAYLVLIAVYRKRKAVYPFAATVVPVAVCVCTIDDYNGLAKDYGILPSVLFFAFIVSIAYAVWLCIKCNQ